MDWLHPDAVAQCEDPNEELHRQIVESLQRVVSNVATDDDVRWLCLVTGVDYRLVKYGV